MKSKSKGPQFVRFLKPVLTILRDSGGSATTAEVIDKVIAVLEISDAEQEEMLKNGGSRVRNQIQWARFYLVKAGYLDSSKRGVWSVTAKGADLSLGDFDAIETFSAVQKTFSKSKSLQQENEGAVEDGELAVEATNYRVDLLNIVKTLPPEGFERLCQRLLRESGFQQVVVTGRTEDGGIDGVGVLQINPFVTFNVLFQCKRYRGSVSPSEIRDFRGAMMGRADKGIILTTGTFTADARREARRDGVPPIELVAGEDLVSLFESLELGLTPQRTFEVNRDFFAEFSSVV